MKKFVYVLFLLVSNFVIGNNSEMQCALILLDSSFPFNVEALVPEPLIPKTVVASAKNMAQGASLAGVVSVSSGLVTQGSRISALSSILTCDAGSDFSAEALDWSDSPTQISLGKGVLQYVDGAVLGNWLIWVAFEATYTLLARRLGDAKLRYPGFAILPFLFLSTPTARTSVTMMRLGNPVEKTMGVLSLAAQLGVTAKIAHALWPSRFGATVYKEEWLSKKKQPEYLACYGLLFEDYRRERYGYIIPECLMSMSSGILSSFQIEPGSSCPALLAASTGVYGVYALGLVMLHPHLDRVDRVYFAVVATAEALSLLFGSIQQGSPSLKNNTAMTAVSEGIPVVLGYVM